MNKVILSGNLTRDPEIRTTPSDKTVATMGIAVRRGWKKTDENQPDADFFNIVAWERLAEFCRNYLSKGSKIIVEGRLQSRSYEAKDGTKRYVTEVIANEIEFASSKSDRPREGGYDERPSAGKSSAPGNELEHVDDVDIPF